MRSSIAALTLPLLSLAACGGAGTESVPVGFGAGPATGFPNPTPPPAPAPPAQAHLFDVTASTDFKAVGALQSLNVSDKGVELYKGNASTVAAPSGTITYSPRDGIFTVKLADASAGVTREVRFQDPGHRADADSAQSAVLQVPLLTGFNYLQALDGEARLTFFYKRPGSTGSFVSLAGFERSEFKDKGESSSEQGVLVFGAQTSNLQVPTRGTGHYDGQFLATMVGQSGNSPSVLQWMNGTSAVDVDFGARTVALSLNGVVGPAYAKNIPVNNDALAIASGTIFNATGSASWAQGNAAFAGKFSSAGFTSGSTTTAVNFNSVNADNGVAGASSIDGTFYGPDAKNIGGNFRITGGIPNQRVDILGAFAGAKK